MLDLGADACIPCKMMAPIMAKLEKEYKGRADIIFIDVWKKPEQAKRFKVKAIPTQIFFDKNGKEVGRHVGFLKEAAIVGKLKFLGVEKCAVSGSLLYRLNLKGQLGAFGLGLAYGILSGSCTFGFIAPILAIITVQKQMATGILFILLFAVGHCLPIVVAGSSTAAVKRVMENSKWQGAGKWFRKGAGIVIVILGAY
ncbi:MAG: thioredoxin fold domain-containing protein, partial [Deltaproteobacteria bacterium]|nr:thioredoxin fold domain-containing protein [Deltaproteobacteria bacterium]